MVSDESLKFTKLLSELAFLQRKQLVDENVDTSTDYDLMSRADLPLHGSWVRSERLGVIQITVVDFSC